MAKLKKLKPAAEVKLKDRVVSITATGSGGKGSKELEVNFEKAGTLVVSADVAGGAFSAIATIAQAALMTGAIVDIEQIPGDGKKSPRLTQITLHAPQKPRPVT